MEVCTLFEAVMYDSVPRASVVLHVCTAPLPDVPLTAPSLYVAVPLHYLCCRPNVICASCLVVCNDEIQVPYTASELNPISAIVVQRSKLSNICSRLCVAMIIPAKSVIACPRQSSEVPELLR